MVSQTYVDSQTLRKVRSAFIEFQEKLKLARDSAYSGQTALLSEASNAMLPTKTAISDGYNRIAILENEIAEQQYIRDNSYVTKQNENGETVTAPDSQAIAAAEEAIMRLRGEQEKERDKIDRLEKKLSLMQDAYNGLQLALMTYTSCVAAYEQQAGATAQATERQLGVAIGIVEKYENIGI